MDWKNTMTLCPDGPETAGMGKLLTRPVKDLVTTSKYSTIASGKLALQCCGTPQYTAPLRGSANHA